MWYRGVKTRVRKVRNFVALHTPAGPNKHHTRPGQAAYYLLKSSETSAICRTTETNPHTYKNAHEATNSAVCNSQTDGSGNCWQPTHGCSAVHSLGLLHVVFFRLFICAGTPMVRGSWGQRIQLQLYQAQHDTAWTQIQPERFVSRVNRVTADY